MKRWFVNNLPLLTLLITLGVIVAKNFNPHTAIAGWDNFSVSLSTSTNLVRTIFSSWRSYRGLGAPSDSEVVDVFRQVFYFALSWLPTQFADQAYIFSTLIVGVTGLYFLSRFITKKTSTPNNINSNMAALISSLIFLFSLNTIGTYFFPMPMYIARFAFFPWIIYLFMSYLQESTVTNLLRFAIVSFLASSSYLTATVFVTLSIILGVISLLNIHQFKKLLILGFIIILTNSFWLLPFGNYTLHKSKLIPLSSVFTIVNENQLNESPKDFDWPYLLTMYPNFLHIDAAINPQTNISISLHPEINKINPYQNNSWPIYSLVILGTIGSVFAVFSKKTPWARFIPISLVISLFMLRKEYPPVGYIYDLLGEKIPYFKVLFRFGDTKFNYLLALISGLGIGIGISQILSFSRSKIYRTIVVIPFIVITFFTFRQFNYILNGQFISNFVQVNIPPAYFNIAHYINQDPSQGRVIHLPYDRLSYFKSHSWGYFGSTFMAFILDKPLFDRAFAPASPVNDSIDLKLIELAQNFRNLKDLDAKTERIVQLSHLLAITNTRYLIYDQTVTINNVAGNITLWGEFMQDDYAALIEAAAQAGALNLVHNYTVDVSSPNNTITLYQTASPSLDTQTISKAQPLELSQENVLDLSLSQNNIIYQTKSSDNTFYPFHQTSNIFKNMSQSLESSLSLPIQPGRVSVNPPSTHDTYNFQIYAYQNESTLFINLKNIPYPFPTSSQSASYTMQIPLIQVEPYISSSTKLTNFTTDWHTFPFDEISSLRLSVDKTVIPLPANLTTTPQYITTITTGATPFELSLIVPDRVTQLSNLDFKYTEDPNCFKDKSYDYAHDLLKNVSDLKLSTKNGTSCIIRTLPIKTSNPYVEIKLNYELTASNEQINTQFNSPSIYQQQLLNYVDKMPTANYFTACLVDPSSGQCLNNHNTFNATNRSLTLANSSFAESPPEILISLPTIGTQSANLTLGNMTLSSYKTIVQSTVDLDLTIPPAQLTDPVNTITLPKSLSTGSYYFNPQIDAFRTYNESCKQDNSYRTTKHLLPNTTIAYTHNCYSGLYTTLPFDSSHFYLWQTSYHLFSGKYPSFILSSPNNLYLQKYLSWDQGYPNILGSRNLQLASPTLSTSNNYLDYIEDKLKHSPYESTSTYYYPQPGLETEPRLFTITQNSQNQGLLGLNEFNIMELPTSWENLRIDSTHANNTKFNENVKVSSIIPILPSFWQINLQSLDSSPSTQDTFLHFSQAYDDQWELYRTDNPLLAILGFGKVARDHVRVNGLTNGWIFPTSHNEAETITYFALYTPERLAITGWIITLTTMVSLMIYTFVEIKLKRARNRELTLPNT